ncbi:MAG: hypothetical protein KKF41_03170 [Actinobacteria bacterium]|nr:hypothetical protein [Actinomycetota bacterium]MBU1943312.1 hypothetical protein [Actinomycetota bacterium]MBU2686570.1 hypothetical protein [Actinomycetota bacterium]
MEAKRRPEMRKTAARWITGVGLLIVSGLLMALLMSEGTEDVQSAGWTAVAVAATCLLISGVILITVEVYRSVSGYKGLGEYIRKHARLSAPGSYDPLRFKFFRDALDAISLGIGSGSIPLDVVEFSLPIAYSGSLAGKGMTSERGMTRRRVVISRPLLQSDLSGPEVEALVADVVARFYLENVDEPGPGIEDGAAAEFGRNRFVIDMLRQDAWAARLTNNPKALTSAIEKNDEMLRNTPLPVAWSDPTVFVDPVCYFAGRDADPELEPTIALAIAKEKDHRIAA